MAGRRNYEWVPATRFTGSLTQDSVGGITESLSKEAVEATLIEDGFLLKDTADNDYLTRVNPVFEGTLRTQYCRMKTDDTVNRFGLWGSDTGAWEDTPILRWGALGDNVRLNAYSDLKLTLNQADYLVLNTSGVTLMSGALFSDVGGLTRISTTGRGDFNGVRLTNATGSTTRILGVSAAGDVAPQTASGARALIGAVDSASVGVANGVASLGSDGRVPSAQLPSYVDDVLEFATLAAFPGTGETGKIYLALNTNLAYRWGGSSYVEISPSLALGETSATAYRGDRGKTAYDHSQVSGSNPHGTTFGGLVGDATFADPFPCPLQSNIAGLWTSIADWDLQNHGIVLAVGQCFELESTVYVSNGVGCRLRVSFGGVVLIDDWGSSTAVSITCKATAMIYATGFVSVQLTGFINNQTGPMWSLAYHNASALAGGRLFSIQAKTLYASQSMVAYHAIGRRIK